MIPSELEDGDSSVEGVSVIGQFHVEKFSNLKLELNSSEKDSSSSAIGPHKAKAKKNKTTEKPPHLMEL
jgi:hypothetical protein